MSVKNMCSHINVAASMVRGVLSTPLPLFFVTMLTLLAFVLALGADPPLLEAPPETRVTVTAAIPAAGAAWLGVMSWRDRFVVPAVVAAAFAGYAVCGCLRTALACCRRRARRRPYFSWRRLRS